MGRLLRLQGGAATAFFCVACGSSSNGTAADASTSSHDDGGGASSPDSGSVVGLDGSPGCDACMPPAGDSGPGADSGVPAAFDGVLTYHNDNGPTGQTVFETTLTPASVDMAKFGKTFSQTVDSYVYAQPLFVPGLTIGGQVHDVVFVVTEANSVYALDASAELTA